MKKKPIQVVTREEKIKKLEYDIKKFEIKEGLHREYPKEGNVIKGGV